MNRKLDMRVWVVVPSWNPLQIYMYRECYIRFSCNDYDPKNSKNLFSHLTNNSVAKKCLERPDNKKMLNKIPGNMWTLSQFRDYLNKRHRGKEELVEEESGESDTEQAVVVANFDDEKDTDEEEPRCDNASEEEIE
jgi:hypothetical protein